MNKIHSIRELPSWFDLNNYDYLSSTDKENVFHQLKIRSYIKQLIDDEGIAIYETNNGLDIAGWLESIERGNTNLESEPYLNGAIFVSNDSSYSISSGQSVYGFNAMFAKYIHDSLESEGLVKVDEDYVYIKHELMEADVNIGAKKLDFFQLRGGVTVHINLEEYCSGQVKLAPV